MMMSPTCEAKVGDIISPKVMSPTCGVKVGDIISVFTCCCCCVVTVTDTHTQDQRQRIVEKFGQYENCHILKPTNYVTIKIFGDESEKLLAVPVNHPAHRAQFQMQMFQGLSGLKYTD